MKVVILAGGYGSRLANEVEIVPKPLIEIGDRPILWHIMMHFSVYGFRDFVIALGFKGEMVKRYLVDYCSLQSDLTIDLRSGETILHNRPSQDWIVELVDTGPQTKTGGRLKKVADRLQDETFILTWGDSISDVNLDELLKFHRSHGKLATITAVRPTARYGYMVFNGDKVVEFAEKPQLNEGWVNGAYYVLEPGVIDYIEGDDTVWEFEPLNRLAVDDELRVFRHTSFWQCVDTPREKYYLEALWGGDRAPWKTWSD